VDLFICAVLWLIYEGGRDPIVIQLKGAQSLSLSTFMKLGNAFFRKRVLDVKTLKIPILEARISEFEVDPVHIRKYKEIIAENTSNELLPYLYYEVAVGSLLMRLMLHQDFPFPILGAVHLKNFVKQYRDISSKEIVDINLKLHTYKAVFHGTEVEWLIEAFNHNTGEKIWENITTNLYFHKHKAEQPSKMEWSSNPDLVATGKISLDVPSNIGRKYAALCSDYNPIHLYGFTARLFGFKKAIAHGMWILGRSLDFNLKQRTTQFGTLKYPIELYVEFRRPIYLPSKVIISTHSDKSEKDKILFQIHDESSILCQQGTIASTI